jgi:hypothetical protein
MQSVGGPLTFLAVSSSWTEAIIASSHLWDTILFDGGEDEEARIHTFSHLSQNLPLYLIYIYSGDGKIMEHFINNHFLRIRSIEDGNEFQEGAMLSTVLGKITTSLPALRYLEGSVNDIPGAFFSNCVNLRVVQRPRVRIADEACMGPHVESIGFYDVDPRKIVKLTHRANIRTLVLDLRRRGNNRFWDEKTGGTFKAHMANFFTRMGQSLNNLTLRISFRSYSTLIPLLSSIPGLHTLALHLNATWSVRKDPPILSTLEVHHSDIENVRILSIMLLNASHFDEDDPGHGYWAGFDSRLADVLIQSFTVGHALKELDVFTFYCDIPHHENYMGSLVQSAVNAQVVRAFSICDVIRTALTTGRQLMPRLQLLELPSLGLYSCIDAPNLIELIFTFNAVTNVIPVEISSTTHLQKLTLPASLINYTGTSMQSLSFTSDICPRDITLLSRLEGVEFSQATAANEFLLKILESPEACPRLHAIAISGYPLWELLFEVLRKRNSSSLRHITRICLPHLPVLQLLWRLVRLLGGETTVFTNRDVDEVIEKRMLCPQM